MDSKIVCFQLTEKEQNHLPFKNQNSTRISNSTKLYLVPGGDTTFKESSDHDKLM